MEVVICIGYYAYYNKTINIKKVWTNVPHFTFYWKKAGNISFLKMGRILWNCCMLSMQILYYCSGVHVKCCLVVLLRIMKSLENIISNFSEIFDQTFHKLCNPFEEINVFKNYDI